MPAAARLNDTGKGHECFPDTAIIAGSPDVIINGQPAARVGDALAPHGCPCSGSPHGVHGRTIAAGSSNVFFNGKAAARTGDAIDCGGKIITGSGDVIIGNTPWQSPTRECGQQAVLRGAPLLALTPEMNPDELTETVALLSR